MKAADRLAEAFTKFSGQYPAKAEEMASEILAAIDLAAGKMAMRDDTQDHTMVVKATGPDRKIYVLDIVVTLPKGTVINGVGIK